MAAAVNISPGQITRSWRASFLLSILLGFVSSVLLDFCFPVAGPMPAWRGLLAWIALVPLLYALLNDTAAAHPRCLRRAALVGYLSGILWYVLNCYWIYQTMLLYGGVPPLGSAGIVFLFSAVLGLYFGAFGLLLAFFRRRFGLIAAVCLAPFLWTALELAAARITSVPWDQLGYSQIDNICISNLATVTGVYGISWLLVALSALWTWALLRRRGDSLILVPVSMFLVIFSILVLGGSYNRDLLQAPTSATAVLLQDNLSVAQDNSWTGQVFDQQSHSWVNLWDRNIGRFLQASRMSCTYYLRGMPQTGLQPVPPADCYNHTPVSLIAWPEAPSPFRGWDTRFTSAMASLTQSTGAAVVAGNISSSQVARPDGNVEIDEYNSASVFAPPDGHLAGRYDKIHLVPFGEYVPYRQVFFFAKHLTQQVGDFGRGARRSSFATPDGHRFGVFICYESVFADEIRHFALNGAQVLVNISDDGWYGDTSAPWQHLNMVRMRAIENRRWLLRDTNNGVTAAIDPYGRVTQSTPRKIFTSLAVQYGYRSDLTFYTRHGDVFAYLCCVVCLGAVIFGIVRKRDPHARPASAASAFHR